MRYAAPRPAFQHMRRHLWNRACWIEEENCGVQSNYQWWAMHTRGFIVVADDDRAIAQMVCDLLIDEGFEAIACASGTEAFQAIQTRPPNLVILDLQMERSDSGLSVIQLMRLQTDTIATPVILYSADGRTLREKQDYLRQQYCTVLEKPFGLHELLVMIETHMPAQTYAVGDGSIVHPRPILKPSTA